MPEEVNLNTFFSSSWLIFFHFSLISNIPNYSASLPLPVLFQLNENLPLCTLCTTKMYLIFLLLHFLSELCQILYRCLLTSGEYCAILRQFSGQRLVADLPIINAIAKKAFSLFLFILLIYLLLSHHKNTKTAK